MNRRDFLHPRRLVSSAGKALSAVEEVRQAALQTPPPDSRQLAFVKAERRAMAAPFEILIPCGIPNAIPAAEAALDEIDRLEAQLTVFRDDSEVVQINRRAAQTSVPVEENLYRLLKQAAELYAATGGAYDITTGALTKTWGFYKRAASFPPASELTAVLDRVGMQHVEFDDMRRHVRFRRAGLEINLGSIGKGYALDRAGDILRKRWNVPAALLHGGQSSVYAISSDPRDERGWAVGVRHPWDPEVRLAVVRLRDRGLGTSAATFQHLEYNGRKLGHLLDPRTGWPAEGMASATVLAPTAAEADALATAFFILGVEQATRYCAAHPEVGAVLLAQGEATPLFLGLAPHELDSPSPRGNR